MPGKVLMPILGRPMLEMQIERVKRSNKIDQIVVATSVNPEDKAIVSLCKKIGVKFFCGNPENVLDRFYKAASEISPDHVVRLTGDCPLVDPFLVDELIDFYLSHSCDYASNCQEPILPDGLDAEIMSFSALEQAWREANRPSEQEHVTPFIYSHPERFKSEFYRYHRDLSYLRWTVDVSLDLEFVRKVYEILYPRKPDFLMEDILDLIEKKPELVNINSGIRRNEGLEKSLVEERNFLSKKKSIP